MVTVKQLKEMLSDKDPDMEVYFAHSSHDYWGSVLASGVREVSEEEIRFTAYHDQYEVPKNRDVGEDDPEEKRKEVVLLS
jgi:hypothetical protein